MANRPAPALALREGDREELVAVDAVDRRCGPGWRSGRGSCCWPRTGCRTAEIARAGRGVAADGDLVAGPVCRLRGRRAGRRAALGSAADGRPGEDRDRDVDAAAEEARGDALVVAAAGQAAGDRRRHGGRRGGITGCSRGGRRRSSSPPTPSWSPRSPTSSGCTWRRRRTRSCSAWTRSRRSRRWTGPRRCCRCNPGWPSAAPTTTSGTAPRPCSPRWRSPPARSPRRCKPRHRHQEFLAFLKQVARAYPDRELHLVMDNYAAHKHPKVKDWLAAQPADPRPLHPDLRVLAEPGRGLVRDHRTPSHPPRHLHLRHATSTPRSAPSSTAGTTAANPSSGPRPPTRSSRKPTVRRLQTRGTSASRVKLIYGWVVGIMGCGESTCAGVGAS